MNRRTLLVSALVAGLLSACGGDKHVPAPLAEVALPPVTTLAAGVTQTTNLAVDQYIQGQLVEQRIPGITLVVVRDGAVIYAKAYGYASLESRRPVKPEDRFEIGSITKTFTASAIMLLVEEGKLSLDDKLSKFLAVPPAWNAITIRHLLGHTSGLPRSPDSAFIAALGANLVMDEDAVLERYRAYPLDWVSGTKYGYSNVGYGIIGMVIAKVTGKPYFEFLRERFFTPLGMTSVRQIAPKLTQEDNAIGYGLSIDRRSPVPVNDATLVYLGAASSGIQASAMDMAKWDAALYTEQLMKKSTLDLMWTNYGLVQAANATDPDIHYGLGWQLRTQAGVRWVYHSGGMAGHVTDFMRYPERKLSVTVLTNLGSEHVNARKIVRAVSLMFDPTL